MGWFERILERNGPSGSLLLISFPHLSFLICSTMQKKNCFLRIMKEGFVAGKNPRLALAYMSGFAARGDSEVVTTFLSLWVYQTAIAANLSATDALSRAGIVSGVAQTCAVCFAPIAGYVCDKLHRIAALAILAFIAALGYTLVSLILKIKYYCIFDSYNTCFTSDPLGVWMMAGACVVGCGEIGKSHYSRYYVFLLQFVSKVWW